MVKSFRKNKKAFSLVELIIVIAIMVALIAVMAPQFVKYVKQSRDSVITQSAENVLEIAKAEFAKGNLKVKTGSESGRITVHAVNQEIHVDLDEDSLEYEDDQFGLSGAQGFQTLCGVDTSRKVLSQKVLYIEVTKSSEGALFAVEESSANGG